MAKTNRLFKVFLGIDISKEKFDVCCIDNTGEKLFRLSLFMERGRCIRELENLGVDSPLEGNFLNLLTLKIGIMV